MRVRDLGILLISLCGVFLVLEHGGDYELRLNWVLELDTTQYKNGHFPLPHEKLPNPLVTDLDGDGKKEIVIVTREPKIKIFDASNINEEVEDAVDLSHFQKAQASLASKIGMKSGRQPVALASGYLHPYQARHRRKQVIVVVLQEWAVLCFDHKLQLLWEVNPSEHRPSGFFHREVGIAISPVGVRQGDAGAVVVGGSLEMEDHNLKFQPKSQPPSPVKSAKSSAAAKDAETEQIVDELLGYEQKHQSFDQQLHHFSYYALEGKSGVLRWSHTANDFHPHEPEHEVLLPQHNYKLELNKDLHHVGEMDWRFYRASLLSTLPHSWTERGDTRMDIAHFSKKVKKPKEHKEGVQRNKHHYDVGLSFQKAKEHHALGKGKIMPHNDADLVRKPNVVVAHVMHGIEVIHLFTGRTLCQVTLPPGLYSDVNGDGAVDRIQAEIGDDIDRRKGHTFNDDESKKCLGVFTTGVPPVQPLFNRSVCEGSPLESVVRSMSGDANDYHLKLAAPAVLHKRGDLRNPTARFGMDTVFFSSAGLISSVGAYGQINWVTPTDLHWRESVEIQDTHRVHGGGASSHHEDEHAIRMPMHPVVTPIELDNTGHEHILALGEESMALLDVDGNIVMSGPLVDAPITKPSFGDYNNDGTMSVIVPTHNAFYGYSIISRPGSRALTYLVGGLLVLLVAVFLLHTFSALPSDVATSGRAAARRAPKDRRSTD